MIITYYGDMSSPNLDDIMQFLKIKYFAIEQVGSDIDEPTIISRITLSEFELTAKQIKKQISTERRKYDLVVVEPKTAEIASLAARDNRVDVIRINPKVGLGIFNKRYATRLDENEKGIELDLSFFWRKNIAKFLRPLTRILETFDSKQIPTLLTNLPQYPEHLRSYRGLQAFGRMLGLSNNQTNGKFFIQRVKRNRKKQDGSIPFPGVEIIGSEE